MPYLRVWIHLVWSTKYRSPIITPAIRPKLLGHIKEKAIEKKIYVDCISAVFDHVHALVSLKADQSIADIVRLLKGESSHWVNSTHLTALKFEWQDDYYASSVGDRDVKVVRAYIRNQETHHCGERFSGKIGSAVDRTTPMGKRSGSV